MKIEWIEPGIIAGGSIPVGIRDFQSLRDRGIRAVVTLVEHPLTIQTGITPRVLSDIGLTCLHAPIKDQHPPDIATMAMVVRFINQMKSQHHPVYVHCHAGVGRTGTILHAYYLEQGLSLEEAMAKIKLGKLSSQFLLLSDVQQAFLREVAQSNSLG